MFFLKIDQLPVFTLYLFVIGQFVLKVISYWLTANNRKLINFLSTQFFNLRKCIESIFEEHYNWNDSKYCRSSTCFDCHKRVRHSKGVEISSRCDSSYRCVECESVVERSRQTQHCCGEYKCAICKTFVLKGHLRYIQSETHKPPNDKLIFYDFETEKVQANIL